jgi:signal transduction histidine kinase
VRQDEGGLIERSSREGFEENAAFDRLKTLVRTLLAEAVEPRRYDFRQKAGISRRRTTTFDEVRQLAGLQKIRALLVGLPEAKRVEATAVLEKESTLLSEKIDALEDRQRVLEAKSSLGAIVGEVLHEGAPAAGYIGTTSVRLQSLFPHLLNNGNLTAQANEEFPRKLRIMKENGAKLTMLFTSLQPLAGGKRGPLKLFRPIGVISSAKEIFGNHDTVIDIHASPDLPEVMGHPDDLTTAIVNLFGNSIHWLEQTKIINPRVDVRLFRRETELVIYIEDNGPGISSEFIESIFEVGFTLKEGGTGLGLNIARESLARSGATLGVHLDYENGARFEIRYQL